MAEQQKVQPGKLIVRQVGGTDGTHEVQISHDGTKSIIESKLGELQVSSNLVVTGSTTLSTSLNGILKASSGVVSGSANLDDLGDVIITTPMLNQILKYNGTNWINSTGGDGGATILDELDDVIITTLTAGDILYTSDGTNFINAQPGATSGVQPYDIDLDTIANLAQSTGNVIRSNGTVWQSVALGLDDLSDVVISSLGTNDIIYYNGTNWINVQPGATSGLQPYDSDLADIASLTHTNGNVISSNGTVWQSVAFSLDNLSDVAITGVTSGNILYYNGTNFVNAAPGVTSGVQPYDADLTTIAGLSHTSGNVIRSNGTVWQSTTVSLDDLGDVIITSPATSQTLTYNGTNWVNSTVSSGGDPLDSYFNSSNTVINRTDLNSTALTNAYQYTGTGRAVVTSIHVTNVDGTNEFEVDAVLTDNSDGTTDYYLAKSMPVPANTAVELLRRPKVLEQNDRLKFRANGTSKLQVVATVAPFDTNTTLFNKFLSISTTSQTTVYTESNASGSVIESILLANDDSGTNGVQITVHINDGTNDTALSYTLNIPQKSSVELCEGPKFLPNTGSIKVTASDANRCDISISGRKL